jgi:hypothetical protein
MLDFGRLNELSQRVETFTTDLDSRLEEVNNRLKIANGLLSLIARSVSDTMLSPAEKQLLDGIYETAFGDRQRVPFAPTGMAEQDGDFYGRNDRPWHPDDDGDHSAFTHDDAP